MKAPPRTPTQPSGRILSDQQRLEWLRLIRSENVGPATFRELLNYFGSAGRALEALPDLSAQGGRSRQIKIMSDLLACQELQKTGQLGARFIAMGEPDYPPNLRHIESPPPLVCMLGGVKEFGSSVCAIVGGRRASLAGRKVAGQLAAGLGQYGVAIASGLARGIDTAAHQGALGTGTIAVFAGGIDYIYPPENKELADEIVEKGGAILTEMPLGWSPRSHDFPRRNRIISGVSLGVIVVEAATRSGSLHTARFAAEQGRQVFAVPASPLDPRSEGCNHLIRNGSTLITGAEQVYEDLKPMIENPMPLPMEVEEPTLFNQLIEPGTSDRQQIIDNLSSAPIDIDELIRSTGIKTTVVQRILLELELAGHLERHPGNKVSWL